jgi:dsRNA-specific ribonuclease
MTAKLYQFPKTQDGKYMVWVAVLGNEPRHDRNFDAEADAAKARYAAKKARREAEAIAAEEAARVAQRELDARKILPFRRVAGGRR